MLRDIQDVVLWTVTVNTTYNITGKENPSGVYWGSNPNGGKADYATSYLLGGIWPVVPMTHSGFAGLDDPNPSYNSNWTNSIQIQRDGGKEERDVTDSWLGGSVDITPIEGLVIHADYTRNMINNTHKEHIAKLYSHDPIRGIFVPMVHAKESWVTMDNKETTYQAFNAIVDYTFNISKNNFKVLAGMNYEDNESRWFYSRRIGLISDDLPAMDQATGASKINYSEDEWGILGYFGRINYNFDEKYFLELNVRYDGSSRFPDDDRYGLFPSFSSGWTISNESFFEPLKSTFDLFKIRGSWGELGHSPDADKIGLYPYIPTLGTTNEVGAVIGGVRPIGISAAGLTSDMTWETVKQWNVGVDVGLFRNKLTSVFDYYNRATEGMIGAGAPLPAVLGSGVPNQNSSDLMTKGYELAITWRSKLGKDFFYNVGVVFSDNWTEITKFNNPTGLLSANYAGFEMGTIFGYTSDGVFQSDAEAAAYQEKYDLTQITGRVLKAGDVRYLDVNGDGKVTPGLTTDDMGDYSIIGNSSDRYMYGVNLGCNWKGIDFRMLLQGIAKRDVNLSGYSNIGNEWAMTDSYMNDTWTPENPGAYWPRVTVGDGANTKSRTSAIENAGFLRLKDITVGYTLPKTWLSKVFFKDVRVYFSGYNLLTITGLRDDLFDLQTKDRFAYPTSKSVSFGIDIVL